MKIVFVVPGFEGTFYCQNCIRDIDLIEGFRNNNYDAILAPVYMPSRLNNSLEAETPVFFGAVNVYLREKLPFYNLVPKFLRKILDSRKLLNWISKKSDSTDPKGLEEMTLSVMKGDEGKHHQDLKKMIDWLKNDIKPDIVHVSNLLLTGIAVQIKKELGIKVFVSLQDENTWIDLMDMNYQKKIWDVVYQSSSYVDSFISVSQYYKDFVMEKTSLPSDKINVSWVGVPSKNFVSNKPSFDPPIIGFISRISKSLGFDILLDAFIELKKLVEYKDLRLRVTGGMSSYDKPFIKEQFKKIKKHNLSSFIEWEADLFKTDMPAFFKGLTVVSVPAPNGEAFGLFQLQALASGIPLVLPAKGAFSEVIAATKGGVTFESVTVAELSKTLNSLLSNPEKVYSLSTSGLKSIEEKFSIDQSVKRLLNIYSKYDGENKEGKAE